MGVLYVVATPIGNLEDITIRAIKILLSVPVIACEDTRHTGNLIKILKDRYSGMFNVQYSMFNKFISVRDYNEVNMIDKIILELASNDVALVSDAGTPLISDPGYKIVRAARAAGYTVSPIPGANAAIAALSAAGLPTNKFIFLGFLGKKWELLPGYTHVIYESPNRTDKTCRTIRTKYPEAEIVLAREMTKIHEEIFNIQYSMFNETKKGEVTVLVYLPEEVAAGHGNGDGKGQQSENSGGDVG
ncbi:MAG: 16S rRNA (cytidine1402-2'-O)-methyltransferase [Microgenomates group bacterium Gr01-1014_16]|nr:MAG: 16S rRNA (cytidine1402-2'-O)-methyltransferase [Microgenomates group bacterium Gr01-1014_16]